MRTVNEAILGGLLAAAVIGVASGQSAPPASAPASAVPPQTPASRQLPVRNPALTAAENAKEPGNQRPEERVIPQISIPLKTRSSVAAIAASVPSGSRPGGVDDGAARCLALRNADEKAACEGGRAPSAPVRVGR
ncbi:MAG TPA: hypothetical protein VIN03_29105 [Roseateles sp.]